MKNFIPGLLLLLFVWGTGGSTQKIRKAVFAGQFYAGSAETLDADLEAMLASAASVKPASSGLVALIVPHAGYVYSGRVAALGYRMVQGMDWPTVVVLGTAHHHGFRGCSIYPSGGYQTPLGTIEVDAGLADAISADTGFGFIPRAHRREHSIEVQLPFIQKTLPGAKIVPILMGRPSLASAERLAKGLRKALSGRRALVLVSTDMSHFLDRSAARERDRETIRKIREADTAGLMRSLERGENRMCGGAGVVAALLLAGGEIPPRVDVLGYADSSEAGGPGDSVVGYLAAAVYRESPEKEISLTENEGGELLRLARRTLDLFVRGQRIPEDTPVSTRLTHRRGAFVTLKKNRRLRGCIGFIQASAPLYRTVMQAAVFAASRDQRFDPVRISELDDIEIEISVLTPPRKIQDPEDIEVGRHGLIIEQGGHRGLLLPQVPVEQNWNRTTFIRQTCLKAGLPRDAWKKGAEIFVFEARIFKEG